jgi:hypothetical protein
MGGPKPCEPVPVPLTFIVLPNVFPPSWLVMTYVSTFPVLLSFQETCTALSPEAAIPFMNVESEVVELLRFTLSANDFPLSLLALNNTSQFPVLLLGHVRYTLSPEAAIATPSMAMPLGP